MCHIGLPPTNRNWEYCTMAFVSGSGTHKHTGTQEPPWCPRRRSRQVKTTNETRALEIRLWVSSSRSTGMSSKILVLKLCFKVANEAKSWFHGHSCSVLPITTAPCAWLWFLCRRRFCGRIHVTAKLSRTIWTDNSISSSSASTGLVSQVQMGRVTFSWNTSTGSFATFYGDIRQSLSFMGQTVKTTTTIKIVILLLAPLLLH